MESHFRREEGVMLQGVCGGIFGKKRVELNARVEANLEHLHYIEILGACGSHEYLTDVTSMGL